MRFIRAKKQNASRDSRKTWKAYYKRRLFMDTITLQKLKNEAL